MMADQTKWVLIQAQASQQIDRKERLYIIVLRHSVWH